VKCICEACEFVKSVNGEGEVISVKFVEYVVKLVKFCLFYKVCVVFGVKADVRFFCFLIICDFI